MQSGQIKLKLEKSYTNGFTPLKSQNENEELNSLIMSEKTKGNSSLMAARQIEIDGELFELDDDVILDDEFASFLNIDREIIVNDTLYNYTQKVFLKHTFKISQH